MRKEGRKGRKKGGREGGGRKGLKEKEEYSWSLASHFALLVVGLLFLCHYRLKPSSSATLGTSEV
jgi:hypothetical protein